MNGTPLLDVASCRVRQSRLRGRMAEQSLDAVVVVAPEHVQYLTGHRWDFRFAPVAALLATGEMLLICPDRTVEQAAADEVRTYEAKWRSTLRTDQREASSAVLGKWLDSQRSLCRVGVEYSSCPPHVSRLLAGAELVDIDLDMLSMRRRKDPDELALIRRALAASGEMYRVAREMIRPGVNELDVFSSLQTAAIASCGEMLTGTGNDYACGLRGGPAARMPKRRSLHSRLGPSVPWLLCRHSPHFRRRCPAHRRTVGRVGTCLQSTLAGRADRKTIDGLPGYLRTGAAVARHIASRELVQPLRPRHRPLRARGAPPQSQLERHA